jgi:hypothetical protein
MMMFPKDKTWRSEKYLKFIRQQPCAYCFKESHIEGSAAHHINGQNLGVGIGIKISDLYTIPLCARCHAAIHLNQNILDQKRTALQMIDKAIKEGVLVIK